MRVGQGDYGRSSMGNGRGVLLIRAACTTFLALSATVVSANPEPFACASRFQLRLSQASLPKTFAGVQLTLQQVEEKPAALKGAEENGRVDGPTQRATEISAPTNPAAGIAVRPRRVAARPAQTSAMTTATAEDTATWRAIGPFPIPNGQTTGRVDPVSGRVTAIAIDPTDAKVAYIGTAQGGLYQTLDGGATWTQMMDNAVAGPIGTPLAIGSVMVNPSDPQVVYVGTGEGNNNFDGAFGSGFYTITGAKGAAPILNGPLNLASAGHDIFAGRSIASMAIDPMNGNNVFCGTTFGFRGYYSADESPVRPPRGLYRSTNALSSVPTWARLNV
ncbi:MAG: WD40/YVTN/BNR-like repeat-containing protein, partial [Chthoniobacterales bacterium]